MACRCVQAAHKCSTVQGVTSRDLAYRVMLSGSAPTAREGAGYVRGYVDGAASGAPRSVSGPTTSGSVVTARGMSAVATSLQGFGPLQRHELDVSAVRRSGLPAPLRSRRAFWDSVRFAVAARNADSGHAEPAAAKAPTGLPGGVLHLLYEDVAAPIEQLSGAFGFRRVAGGAPHPSPEPRSWRSPATPLGRSWLPAADPKATSDPSRTSGTRPALITRRAPERPGGGRALSTCARCRWLSS
jgi:hypothetical protein